MRQLIICAMLTFLFSQTLSVLAQPNMGGFFAGVNMGNISEEPEEDGVELKSRTALLVGGLILIDLPGSPTLVFAPTYAQKGSKINGSVQDPSLGLIDTEQVWKLTYLDIPVLFRFNFQSDSKSKPYVFIGPNIGFLISAKVGVESVSIDGVPQDIRDEDVDIKEFFKSTDFGLNLGGGLTLPFGKNSIFLEAAYNLGIANVGEIPEGEDGSVKNRGLQLKGGILFPLGK